MEFPIIFNFFLNPSLIENKSDLTYIQLKAFYIQIYCIIFRALTFIQMEFQHMNQSLDSPSFLFSTESSVTISSLLATSKSFSNQTKPPPELIAIMGVWASVTGVLGFSANLLAILVFVRVKKVNKTKSLLDTIALHQTKVI